MGMDPTADEPGAATANEAAGPLDGAAEQVIVPMAVPTPRLLTDEGVPFAWIDAIHLVNLADSTADAFNARRRELHVQGRTYSHVSEDGDQWVYRHD